jgi:hypothetical protein
MIIKRPTYSAQRNTVTFCRKSDLRHNEIVPCLPVIYKARNVPALEHTMGNIYIKLYIVGFGNELIIAYTKPISKPFWLSMYKSVIS